MLILFFLIIGLTLYLLFQGAYLLYHIEKSKQLKTDTFPRKKIFGDAKKPNFTLFITGDSVGQGVGATTFQTSVAGRLAQYFSERYTVHFQNESISGKRFEELLTMPQPTKQQDLVIIIASSNDLFLFTPFETFKRSVKDVIECYSRSAKQMIVIGPGRVYDGEAIPFWLKKIYKHRAPEYVALLKSLTKDIDHCIYINPTSPHFYDHSHGATTALDKFHPNDEGHRLWFMMIEHAIEKYSSLL